MSNIPVAVTDDAGRENASEVPVLSQFRSTNAGGESREWGSELVKVSQQKPHEFR